MKGIPIGTKVWVVAVSLLQKNSFNHFTKGTNEDDIQNLGGPGVQRTAVALAQVRLSTKPYTD